MRRTGDGHHGPCTPRDFPLPAMCMLALVLAGCAGEDDDYFPLGNSQILSYDITEMRSSETYRRKAITQYSGPVTIMLADNRESVYRWLTPVGSRGLLQARDQGIYLIADKDQNQQAALRESATLLLPQPLTAGSRWRTETITELLEWRKHTLEAADRNPAYTMSVDFECKRLDAVVRTPVGLFTNVAVINGSGVRRVEIGGTRDPSTIQIEITEWYAPGVGLIQRERRETTDNQLLNPGTSKMVLERLN